MDNQQQQPNAVGQATGNSQPLVTPPALAVAPPAVKPELMVSDNEALALLTINNLQATARPPRKLPIGMIIALVGLIVLVIAAAAAMGFLKSKQTASPTTSSSSSGQPKQANNDDTNNQINQDVQSCTNPLNALASC